MKKQGDFYLKLTSILLALLLAAYLLCSLFLSREGVYTLETAVYCEVGDGITVSGFVVRDEEVLTCDSPILVTELSEGQRVGGGQTVATGYVSDEARQQREEENNLLAQKTELLRTLSGSDAANAAMLDGEISEKIIALSQQTARQNFSAMREGASALEPLVLRRCVSLEDRPKIEARLAQMDARLAELQRLTAAQAVPICAPKSGYFSAETDGYETVFSPSMLGELTLAQLREADKLSVPASPEAFGRLIFGQTWYFVTQVPKQRLTGLHEGDRLDVSFAGSELKELRMRIFRIGPDDGTNTLLILSCDQKMQSVTAMRHPSADILFGKTEGLRVPKNALYVQDGQAGVYVLEASRAEWKSVEILCQYGDGYLVVWDSSDTSHLWPKDEIIITAEELTDGKVIGS